MVHDYLIISDPIPLSLSSQLPKAHKYLQQAAAAAAAADSSSTNHEDWLNWLSDARTLVRSCLEDFQDFSPSALTSPPGQSLKVRAAVLTVRDKKKERCSSICSALVVASMCPL